MKVSYGSLFIYCGSYLTKPVSLSAWAWAAAPRPVSFRPVNPNETKGANYERQKNFQIAPENRPNQTIRERVVSERGRKELPPSTRGGENLKPNRYYEHKQHAFDSYCKKVLKCEACNGYRQISRRQKRFTSLE